MSLICALISRVARVSLTSRVPTLARPMPMLTLSHATFRRFEFHTTMRPLSGDEIQKPKKPGSAYTLFVMERRPQYIIENPNVKNTDVFKALGAEWKLLTDEEKKRYSERIPGLNQQFEEDMKYYVEHRTDEQAAKDDAPKKKRGVKKAKKDPNMPKRALSAYLFFSNDMRPTLPSELSITEKAVKLGQMWKLTDEHQRQKYVELASKDKVRYDQAMVIYRNRQATPEDSEDSE